MKKIIATSNFIFIILSFIGCKEIPPAIDFSKKVIGLKDTTYITSSVPPAINKIIFVEDLTGVNCNNCPRAATKLHEIIAANPDKVVGLAAYPYSLSQFTAPWPGFEVLNTNTSDDIFKNIYNSPGLMPIGGVNRRVFSGESGVNTAYTKWLGYADIVKVEESPLIINSEILIFDSIKHKAKISVKVLFTKPYVEPVNLTIYLAESKILSKQKMPDGSEKVDYEHNHVLRKAITPYNGISLKIDASTTGNYGAGRTFEKEFEIDLDPKWKKKNLSFVILANRDDANSKEVLQAAELHMQ